MNAKSLLLRIEMSSKVSKIEDEKLVARLIFNESAISKSMEEC